MGLHAGEVIAFDIEDDDVHLRKATPLDLEFAGALSDTLSEWSSELDDEAYRDL